MLATHLDHFHTKHTMLAISSRFQSLRARQECAFIPYITAGDPDLATTAEALLLLDRNGANFLELGIPYSDPLADGPIIQAAATRALQKNIQLETVLEMVQTIAPNLQSPLILFTYYNLILHRGLNSFFQQLQQAGVSGLVVPDLPIEEASDLLQTAKKFGLEVILLIAPTSSKDRIQAIAHQAQGFIYLVSVTGVTGMRTQVETRVQNLITEIRDLSDLPIGVGFGLSTPEQARQVMMWGADAVIVGSAFVQRLADPAQGLPAVETLCRELKAALAMPVLVG
jgi:tryptophan synthase alpha chain